MGPYIRLGIGLGHDVSLTALVAIGLVIGFIAGMFGVGGGFLLTPVLINLFGIPAPIAVGSALCQKCGTSLASFLKYRKLGRGEPKIDLIMLGGSFIGVDAGTRALGKLDQIGNWQLFGRSVPAAQLTLDLLFVLLLSYIAIRTIREAARDAVGGDADALRPGPLITRVRIPPFTSLPRVGIENISVPMLCYLAFVLGFASGLMGIGGGVLFMPILLYGIGLGVKDAAGTGVLLLFVTVASGTFLQGLHGFVSLRLAMAILIGSSVGSQLGALATHHLPSSLLRKIFGALVAATTLFILWDVFGLLR